MVLLSGYAVDALAHDEHAPLERHLSGCPRCQQELDKLRAAAHLLAENVRPVAPCPKVKIALLERIENEQRTLGGANAPRSPNLSRVAKPSQSTKHRWQSPLPYIAATLCAVAVGSWMARYSVLPEETGANPASVRDRTSLNRWQQRIAEAEQALGMSRIQLAKLGSDAPGQGLAVAVFYDSLSGECHVLVSNTAPPLEGRQLWLWLFDRQGAKLSQGKLEYLGQGHAAGVFKLVTARGGIQKMEIELIITDQPKGDHAEPTGPVVGQMRLSMSL